MGEKAQKVEYYIVLEDGTLQAVNIQNVPTYTAPEIKSKQQRLSIADSMSQFKCKRNRIIYLAYHHRKKRIRKKNRKRLDGLERLCTFQIRDEWIEWVLGRHK